MCIYVGGLQPAHPPLLVLFYFISFTLSCTSWFLYTASLVTHTTSDSLFVFLSKIDICGIMGWNVDRQEKNNYKIVNKYFSNRL